MDQSQPSRARCPSRPRSWGALALPCLLAALALWSAPRPAFAEGSGAGVPPPPPPPAWDPSRDRVIRIGPDGKRESGAGVPAPAASETSGARPGPGGAEPAPGPRVDVTPAPVPPRTTAPSPTAPAPSGTSDPWLPGGPAAVPPPPGLGAGRGLPPVPPLSTPDPTTPDPSPESESSPAAAVASPAPGDDPWLTGGGASPPPPDAGAPAAPPVEAATPAPEAATSAPAAPTPAPADADPWLVEAGPGTRPPEPPPPSATEATTPAAAEPIPSSPPAAPNDPWETVETPAAPVATDAPGGPAAPEDPWEANPTPGPEAYPAPGAGEEASRPLPPPRADAGGMRFETPAAQRADEHVKRLLAQPGDRTVPGYPARVVAHADPAVALERGHRPVVILFHDSASRASDLQAAEFLPVLVRYADRIDVVPVDVTDSTAWSPAERKLVRTYYMASVPTTVVLAADRRPLLLKFQRIDGATLEAKLEANVTR